MSPEYVPLISGFFGAILGAGVSLATVWLQQREQGRRDSAKLAVEAAVKEFEAADRYAEFMAKDGDKVTTFDLPYYIVLHSELMKSFGSGASIKKENWVKAHEHALELSDAAMEFYTRRDDQKVAKPNSN